MGLFLCFLISVDSNNFLVYNFDFTYIGYLILTFELSIAGFKAVEEDGHFPLRYLVIFLISALIFYVSVNKSTLDISSLAFFIISIIVLIPVYLYISVLNKKYNLKE